VPPQTLLPPQPEQVIKSLHSAHLSRLSQSNLICSNVQVISLPRAGQQFTGNALVSGWGTLRAGGSIPDELYSVTVPLVSDSACADAYGDSIIPDTMICAGETGKDSCQGDSGGPLICSGGLQCGVVSWGIGCAQEYPGVYAEVSHYIDWLADNGY
jgi:trypsin